MNPKKFLSGTVVLTFLCLGGSGCGSSNGNSTVMNRGAGATPAATSSPISATFTQVNTQILQPKCVSCHSPGSASPDLTSYASFATNPTYVVPGNSAASVLFQQVQSGAMPRGGTPLTAAELALVQQWIDAGALNN